MDVDSDLLLDEPLVLDKSRNTGLKGHRPYDTQGLRMFSGDGDDGPSDGPPGHLLHHLDDQLGFRTKNGRAGKWRGKFLHTTRFLARGRSEVGRQVDRGTQGVDCGNFRLRNMSTSERRSKTNLESLSRYNCSIRAGRVSESERVGRGHNHARPREVWHLGFFTLLLFEINSLRYTLKKDLNGFTCRTTLPGGHKIFSFAQTKMCLSQLVPRG